MRRGGRNEGRAESGTRRAGSARSDTSLIVPESERDDHEVRYQVFDDPNTVPEPVDFVD
jgi:hypothetical protein